MNKFLFLSSYYLVWFGSLILAAYQEPWLALILSLVISTIQLYYLSDLKQTPNWHYFLLTLTLLGFAVDTGFTLTSFIQFKANPWSPFFAPPWILGLWLNFAVLCIGIKDVLRYLQPVLRTITLLGFPLAYLGGQQFDVAVFTYGFRSSLLIGIIWLVFFPLVCDKFLLNTPKI